MMKINNPNTQISGRDLKLLEDIYENVFLSFYQIHEQHFPNRARPTVYNRISKLNRGGYILPLRVSLVVKHRDQKPIGVVYQLGKKALGILHDYQPRKELRSSPFPVNHYTLYHDLLLTDFLKKLNGWSENFKFRNTKVLGLDPKQMSRVPDAIGTLPTNDGEIALELELNAKSEKRYRDIVLQYRMSSQYKKVIYVVANANIHKKIGGIITGFGPRFQPSDTTGKFYFVALEDILKPSGGGKISNGQLQIGSPEALSDTRPPLIQLPKKEVNFGF